MGELAGQVFMKTTFTLLNHFWTTGLFIGGWVFKESGELHGKIAEFRENSRCDAMPKSGCQDFGLARGMYGELRVKEGRRFVMQRHFSLHAVLWLAWLNVTCAAPAQFVKPTIIVAFGDSTTAERGDTKVYATILQEELRNVRVMNAGVGGNTTEMARKRFEKDVLESHPQIAIIQFGINDAAVDVWRTPPATTARVSLKRYEENLRFFVQTLKSHRTRVVMMTPTPLRWTPKLLEMYGKFPYQPDEVNGFNALMMPYCDAVRRVARTESVEFLDMQQAFVEGARDLGVSVDVLLSDGMHPNDKGHRVEAELILDQVCRLKGLQENADLLHNLKRKEKP
jgi:lysophospholipase L1-like esterase